MSILIKTNGDLQAPIFQDCKYLINNFTETKKLTDWTFGTNSLDTNTGILTLTGTSPAMTSATFTVNTNDIIVFEYTVAITTPSTTTGGSGLYLGSKYGQSVKRYNFNYSTNTWTLSSSADTNPYFLYSYNSATEITMITYILGSSVDITKVPRGYCTNNIATYCVQLPSGTTTTNIRSGYNSNSSMVITFKNPRIYCLNDNNSTKTFMSNDYCHANNFIEY